MTVVFRGIVTRLTPMAMMSIIKMTAIAGTATAVMTLLLSSSAWALNKTATVNVSVTIFAAPPCEINSNNTINVNFGDTVLTSNIDGVNYIKPVNYTLNCTAAADNALKISINGNGATFDTNLLKTSNSGLGIKLIRDGQQLALNTTSNFTYPNVPVLQAVPIKQTNATLSTGYFSGTATLVVEYQ
ncbi:fimbrial protein [Yersinia kristensenii]|uniref:Exported pilin protein n=1 Tax=Yersinia kristensenii TaxID=28152 RepID=A0A0T9LJ90_YERKR|nr:fimbrial protein [Yersinia kristensenii]MDA5473375.1 fimbrial protein [Yersinia kristensenii]MDA5477390.1 fimbrial protein [Yersinia kristensenii]MDA5506442.1 fimbrial protein [Yersinia kristensenii]MDA5524322.1 fimbrial protein [Yersinia kristensenii]NIK95764.1 fimbrial protein [Yersinia kristensenii]